MMGVGIGYTVKSSAHMSIKLCVQLKVLTLVHLHLFLHISHMIVVSLNS